MSSVAIITMAVILTVVWGGFIGTIWYAFRCEKRKQGFPQVRPPEDRSL